MQVELGDFDPVETQQKLKPVLKDFIPNEVKNSQPPKEWLEDLCTTHSRMVGFPQQACKENYIRMTMGFDNFGFTTFKLRQCADPAPHRWCTRHFLRAVGGGLRPSRGGKRLGLGLLEHLQLGGQPGLPIVQRGHTHPTDGRTQPFELS